VVPSVFVTDRSGRGVNVSVSVAVLLAGLGSVTPLAATTVAVFASDPVAPAAMLATTVKVAVPPGCSVTVESTLPLPDELPTLEPGEATPVQVSEVTAAGMTSLTVADAVAELALLETEIV
jgi:hypothetical protein